jgi:2-polyprenyl-3-methyl-5-hydroxy-6-metoxy-1,4-benzoquinol methylase
MNDQLRPQDLPLECDVCGHSDHRPLYADLTDRLLGFDGTTFTLWQCKHCGVGRLWPVPNDLEKYYPADYYAYEDSARPRSRDPKTLVLRSAWRASFSEFPLLSRFGSRLSRNHSIISELCAYAPGPSFRLLDVGCGGGAFLLEALRLGIEGEGLELSREGCDAARRRGIVCHEGTLPGCDLRAATYDIVRMSHVLEHMPSPHAALLAARELLRPSGSLVLKVPNFGGAIARGFKRDWYQLDPPRHLWDFDQPSLETLLLRSGFTVETTHHTTNGGTLLHSLRYAATPTAEFPAEVAPATLAAFQRVARFLDEFSAGDTLTLIARPLSPGLEA